MLAAGDFVVSSENDFGIGKLVSAERANAVVEYFYSIGRTEKLRVPPATLRAVFPLPKQTRCYFREGSAWRVGRIGVGVQDTHEVMLPGQQRVVLPNKQLFVRCAKPVDDPLLEILLHKGQETPRFHAWRSEFVEALLRQRAASRAMSGLISSKIELFPHQVEVVRRVLEDPIQRYLLADEVGLGKTIEAGVVLRQFLLDDPDGAALVAVPPLLLKQWQDELRTKFDLESELGSTPLGKKNPDAEDARVVLVSHDELAKVQDVERYGMLIIDEAQHVSAGAFAKARKNYKLTAAICKTIPRVLVLSATPVLHHEKAFLGLLHLLDPRFYALRDLKGFKKRVENRQMLGRLMLTFNENSSSFALKSTLKKLVELFAGDPNCLALCKQLEEKLAQSPPDANAIKELVRTIRTQAAEGLRLHRRMLRTRRETIDPALLIERSVQSRDLHTEPDMGSETEALQPLLEKWRQGALAHSQANLEDYDNFKRVYLCLMQAAGTWEQLLKDVVTMRLKHKRVPTLEGVFSKEVLDSIEQTRHFSHEKEVLALIAKILEEEFEDGDRIELLMQIVKPYLNGTRPGEKAVVFSSFTPAAQAILKRIVRAGHLGSKFAGYCRGMPRKEFDSALEQFRTKPDCGLFVCDSASEEGLNLQFANHAIHFDLPNHPNRLEQRIGRLDRLARSTPLTATVLTGPDMEDSVQAAWFKLLAEGLGIFNQSIASLQFFVETLMPEIETALFEKGATGLLELKAKMPEALAAERVRIGEQEVLDTIDIQDRDARDFHKRLDEEDQRYDAFRRAVHGWVHDGLRYGVKQGADVVEYFVERNTLIPVNTIVRQLSPPSKRRGTFRRVKAVYGDDLCLFRIGEPFIDGLANFTNWDDRGQAFATWRCLPGGSRKNGEEFLAFKLNYIVELDLAKVAELVESLELPELALTSFRRQGDAFLAPRILTTYMDPAGHIITDERWLRILSAPYAAKSDGGADYNLSKELLPLLDELMPTAKWEKACTTVRKASEKLLREAPEFKALCAEKLELAEREAAMQLEQLKLRGKRGDHGVNLADEKKLRDALLEGIRRPRFKLDSCGFFVVSGRAPEI